MSRRFGCKQKRAMRDRITILECKLEYARVHNSGLLQRVAKAEVDRDGTLAELFNLRGKLEAMRGDMKYLALRLTRMSTFLDPSELPVEKDWVRQGAFRLPSMAPVKPIFNDLSEQDYQKCLHEVMLLLNTDAVMSELRGQIHVYASLGPSEVFYAVSEKTILGYSEEELIRLITPPLTKCLVQTVQSRLRGKL